MLLREINTMLYTTKKSTKVKALVLSALLLMVTNSAFADQCPMAYINYAITKAPDVMKKIKHEGEATPSIISCFYDPNTQSARVSMKLDWIRIMSKSKTMWVQGNLDVNAQGHSWTTTMKSKRVEKWDSMANIFNIKL
jgi:hypothetical protein